MRCPYCGDAANRVIDSRLGRDGTEIRRRRECLECSRRFTTRERVDEVLPKVVKHDERREEFSRDKLWASVTKACAKRPLPLGRIEKVINEIQSQLSEASRAEISSRDPTVSTVA